MIVTFWGHEFKINIVVGCIGGFLIAIVSSMFGFGGGPFMVPLMTVALGLPMYVVVGSSLLAIFFAIMFPAAILGGYIAPKIAKRISPLTVKRVAVAGLVILALNLLGVY
jgi:uncharacterized membrane protein YfcA